jgi:riboflavin biosynthesis pyrimidine reductase
MRKLTIFEHISLDGVIQHSADDGDFPYSGWTAPYRTPAGLEAILDAQGEWGPFEGVGPDIVEGVRRIKSQDGADLILWGSSTLTSTLLEHGLADEVVLVVYPVLLGTGKRFFAEGSPARSFALVSTQAMPSGILVTTYKVAGRLKAA